MSVSSFASSFSCIFSSRHPQQSPLQLHILATALRTASLLLRCSEGQCGSGDGGRVFFVVVLFFKAEIQDRPPRKAHLDSSRRNWSHSPQSSCHPQAHPCFRVPCSSVCMPLTCELLQNDRTTIRSSLQPLSILSFHMSTQKTLMHHVDKASIRGKEHSTWTQREKTAAKLLWTLGKSLARPF